MKARQWMIAGMLVLAVTCGAQAASLFYDVGSTSSVSANLTDPGLVINTDLKPNLTNVKFWLNDNQTYTFNFFDIWTDESAVNDDDTVPQSISATLVFDIPSTSGTVGGTTVGVATGLVGSYQYGKVTWNGPAIVQTADRKFSVTLSNEVFNEGSLWGLGNCGATVSATVKQLSSTQLATVPLPMAGVGGLVLLAGLGIVRKMRRAA